MSKIYGSPLFLSGSGGGVNKDLPPLLDNFKAVAGEEENAILVSADKMEESRAKELAGAVWVYGDHIPNNVNDGTKIQLTREECIISQETKSSLYSNVVDKPLESLPSGSRIKLGKLKDTPLQWKLSRDTVTNELRLVLERTSVTLLGKKSFDAAEPSNPISERRVSGNNRYLYSNLHQWLNSDKGANEWYTAQHTYDAPPTYQNEDGFLMEWSDLEKSVLNTNEWKTINTTVDGGGEDIVRAKVAVLSIGEIGGDGVKDGNRLDIFNSDSDRAVGSDCWTRSAVASNPSAAWYVNPTGAMGYTDIKCSGPYSVRTVCAPNKYTMVSDNVDSDGCYNITRISGKVEKQVSWENTKDFYARQFTYNSKKQYQTMLEGAIATLNDVPEGQPITELESGSKVKLGVWNDTPLQWKVARDTSDQSIRLVLEPTSVSLLGNMAYDAAEPSNSNSDRRSSGNNRYIYSNIHQWLNATKASGWYTAQHSADAAPEYSSSPGFLSGWSENHIAALDSATLTTSRASVDGGGTETFVARVALISTTELGLQSNTGGGRLDIFNSDGDRATGSSYWTRTPYPSSSRSAYQVTGAGGLGGNYSVYAVNGVRPLCIPISTVLVSLGMDDDNCYTITGVNE